MSRQRRSRAESGACGPVRALKRPNEVIGHCVE